MLTLTLYLIYTVTVGFNKKGKRTDLFLEISTSFDKQYLHFNDHLDIIAAAPASSWMPFIEQGSSFYRVLYIMWPDCDLFLWCLVATWELELYWYPLAKNKQSKYLDSSCWAECDQVLTGEEPCGIYFFISYPNPAGSPYCTCNKYSRGGCY